MTRGERRAVWTCLLALSVTLACVGIVQRDDPVAMLGLLLCLPFGALVVTGGRL